MGRILERCQFLGMNSFAYFVKKFTVCFQYINESTIWWRLTWYKCWRWWVNCVIHFILINTYVKCFEFQTVEFYSNYTITIGKELIQLWFKSRFIYPFKLLRTREIVLHRSRDPFRPVRYSSILSCTSLSSDLFLLFSSERNFAALWFQATRYWSSWNMGILTSRHLAWGCTVTLDYSRLCIRVVFLSFFLNFWTHFY